VNKALRPETLKEAVEMMAGTEVILLAGGTDLMVRHKRQGGLIPQFEKPVLFIGHLEELGLIVSEKNCISIGPCCTYSSLINDHRVPEVLRTCIRNIAAPAVRNRGTLGGNICNASPAGDTIPVLVALGASVVLSKADGRRIMLIDEFVTGPGTTVRKDDELLTGIIVPQTKFNFSFYRKVGTRRYNSLSKVSIVGLMKVEEERVSDVRVAFGAVAPTVVRSRAIEEYITGTPITDIKNLIPEICKRYADLMDPIDDQRSTKSYRKAVSLRLLRLFFEHCTSKS
jgi:xanthine dehydrogenase FAD-binding subunit